MTEDLVLPVPDTLPAMYLVPARMPERQALRTIVAAVEARVAEPLRRLTTGLLVTGAVMVARRRPDELPFLCSLRPAAHDLPPEQAAAANAAPEYTAFATLLPIRPGPVHEWATRAAAGAVAATLGLPVVDAFCQRAFCAETALASLPGAPELTDVDGGFRLADWVTVHRDGPVLATHGLGRFGLPELKVSDVPAELRSLWLLALNGVGHRLLELLRCELRRGGETPFVQVPAELAIRRADIGNAYGVDLDGGGALPVRLVLDPAVTDQRTSYLTLHAPDDTSPATHRAALQAALLETPFSKTTFSKTDTEQNGTLSRPY
jgi:hypothetical protein